MIRRFETKKQRRERRIGAWGLSLTYALTFFGTELVVTFAYIFGTFIIKLVGAAGKTTTDISSLLTNLLKNPSDVVQGWVALISYVLAFAVYALIIKSRHEDFREKVSLRPLKREHIMPLIFIGVGLSLTLNCLIGLTLSFVTPLTSNIVGAGGGTTGSSLEALYTSVPGVLSIVLGAPIVEEIIFRGLIFRTMRERLALPVALIGQALIFGVSHGNILQGIMTFGLGCLLAWVYLRTRSLYCTMIVHCGFNTTTVLLMLGHVIGEGGSTSVLLWMILSFVAQGLLVLGLRWFVRPNKEERACYEQQRAARALYTAQLEATGYYTARALPSIQTTAFNAPQESAERIAENKQSFLGDN